MNHLETNSWKWKGQIYPSTAGILIQTKKPDGYKSSQSSSIRFLPEEIKNDEIQLKSKG